MSKGRILAISIGLGMSLLFFSAWSIPPASAAPKKTKVTPAILQQIEKTVQDRNAGVSTTPASDEVIIQTGPINVVDTLPQAANAKNGVAEEDVLSNHDRRLFWSVLGGTFEYVQMPDGQLILSIHPTKVFWKILGISLVLLTLVALLNSFLQKRAKLRLLSPPKFKVRRISL